MTAATTTEIQRAIVSLENDLNSLGWDRGTSVWLLHDDGLGGPNQDESELELYKSIDSDLEVPTLDLVKAIPPMFKNCLLGVVASFESWIEPDRTESVRIVAAALRTGVLITVVRIQNRKPRCSIAPDGTMPNIPTGAADVIMALRAQVSAPVPTMEGHPLSRLLSDLGIGGGVIIGPFFRPPNADPDA
jgi:hypothetical protein